MTAAAPAFEVDPTSSATELRLRRGPEILPVSSWALSRRAGADLVRRFILADEATEDAEVIFVEHAAIARLTADEARRLDLPPVTSLRAVVEGNGIMLRPEFRATLRWVRETGQPVIGASRTGAWLQEAGNWRRLPGTLFAVAEAVDACTAASGGGDADLMRAVARLRAALPPAATSGQADASGMLGTATFIEADAFSLNTVGEGDALQLIPVLHRAGDDSKEPLLSEDQQREFGAKQFLRWSNARSVYTLPGGVYVTLSPPLNRALEVLRRAASGNPQQRRAFLSNPRLAIREALDNEADLALVEALVVETPVWSDRVIGLGLWQPRVLPWIALRGNDWFGTAGNTGHGQSPQVAGLQVGDRCIPLDPTEVEALAVQVSSALQRGEPNVVHIHDGDALEIPATSVTLDALKQIASVPFRDAPSPQTALAPGFAEGSPQILMPIPKDNFLAPEIEALVTRRRTPPPALPPGLATSLKEHQKEGLAWLQQSFAAGNPGVLLADDMGLGKTLQGLAFLAWLRDGMEAGILERRPLLIVAPTGLLENWRAEHDRHLRPPGLGCLLGAYGPGLASLRKPNRDGTSGLDWAAIRAADWVLTTYETLRDYSRDFGAVRFAAMLMDEAQKVKTPGIRMTDAAKAMNADFRIALTGTPVENRLSDLWCIVDGVAPGHLGDLRRFSATYEGPDAAPKLPELKALLDLPYDGRPPLLMRRLKDKVLPGLPECVQEVRSGNMRGTQLAAYEAALDIARDDKSAGRVLEALQRLRQVSLCPELAEDMDDEDLVSSSVRLELALQALDQIHARGERALLFLDSLAFMARLAGLLQRRYRLADAPMAINGGVAGAARQARVDRFQTAADGFDVMMLSPRAGGVGLTLTRANHVIHLARWWNPAVEDQSTARVHRIGQIKPVTVHLPLALLPDGKRSFDENLHALLERKRLLMRDALLPPELDKGELSTMLDHSL